MVRTQLLTTVSGSFRRAMPEVQLVVEQLTDAGLFVLSPADPRIVDQFGDFVFVASDQVRHLRTVQSRHLSAIAASDFLWLVCPDGYVGVSAAMEIGYAAARGVPVYSKEVPTDLTLRQWVTVVRGPLEAVRRRREGAQQGEQPGSLLLEPVIAIQAAHDDLNIIQRGLVGNPAPALSEAVQDAAHRVQQRLVLP